MQPEELFVANLPLIERLIGFVARRNRMQPSDAEEFAAIARLKLIENDYAVLRQFEGKAQLSTYLTVVLQRMHLDLRIHEWGKWRPSAEAKRLGELAILFEQLTHRDGLSFDEAAARIRGSRPEVTLAQINDIQKALPQRPRRPRQEDDSDALLAQFPSDASADASALQREREEAAKRTAGVMSQVIESFDAEEQLILRLRFSDSLKVSSIATMLGLDAKRLYKRIDKLLATMRERLVAAGVSSREAADILAGGADGLELEIFGPESGFAKTRPSLTVAGLSSGGDRTDR
jgi:RNA polymerase sigma factor for flagellar operon FliA